MNIAVCIKQVPLSTQIDIDPETGTLIRNSNETQINPFDEYALEEALLLKEKHGGRISVYTMGPPQAEEILRDALALGIDEVFLLTDRSFAGADSLATSYTLSQAILKNGIPDLVICGKQAIDGDTAQVGPSLSQLLNMSFSALVQRIEAITKEHIIVEQMMDTGYYLVKLKLPAVITVVKGINNPRVASLKGRLESFEKNIEKLNKDDISAEENLCGLKGSPTAVLKSFSPKKKHNSKITYGTNEDLAEDLKDILLPYCKEDIQNDKC